MKLVKHYQPNNTKGQTRCVSPTAMNNTTELLRCSSHQYSPSFLVLGVMSGISAVFSIVGNTVVLWTVYKTESLQCVSNFFIASLALADFLVGLVLNPILAVRAVVFGYQLYTNDIPLGFDIAEDFMWIQGLLISTFSFTAISIDRFIAITRAIYYETVMSNHRCQITIVLLWTSSISVALLRIVFKDKDLPWLWLATIILACLVPLCITCYCYAAIFKTAKLQLRNIVNLSNDREREQHREALKKTKTAFTIAIVIGVFAISYTPSVVVACVNLVIRGKCAGLSNAAIQWPWACLVAYISSAINPWIYSIRSQEFRHAIKKAFLKTNSR